MYRAKLETMPSKYPPLLNPFPPDDAPSAASEGFAAPKAASRAAADMLSAASFLWMHRRRPLTPRRRIRKPHTCALAAATSEVERRRLSPGPAGLQRARPCPRRDKGPQRGRQGRVAVGRGS